jgi:hypothetical protein
MVEWKKKSVKTIKVNLYIGGDIKTITEVCRDFTTEVGHCVSIKPCDYAYKFGLESGVEITFINYPRFPSSEDKLVSDAENLGFELAKKANQGSYTIVGPTKTIMWSRRGDL